MSDTVDFDAAELFIGIARAAFADGDQVRFAAARKLVAVALGIVESPAHMHLAHLKDDAACATK